MRTSVQVGEKGKFKFELVYLKAIDAAPFLASSIPEEVVLALLCKFPKGQGAPQVLKNILEKIKILDAEDPERFKKHLTQLKIIAQLRNLQDETQQQIENTMPHFFDVRKDPSYKKGRVEAIEETQRANIERLLMKKLLSDVQIADALEVSFDMVIEIKKDLIEAGKLKA